MGKVLALALLLAPGRSISYVTVGFSADGRFLVTTGVTLPVKVWELASGKEVRALADRTGWGSRALFLPDGRVLVAGDKDGKLVRFAADGSSSEALGNCQDVIPWAALSRDGKRLASHDDGGIAIRDLAAPARAPRILKTPPGQIWSCEFSPDDKTLAAVFNDDFTLRLWSLDSGQETRKLQMGSQTFCLAFSPDGKTLATGDTGGAISLWDVEKGTVRSTLKHTGPIVGLAYANDGRRLASVSFDGTTRLWDPATGREIRRLKGGMTTVAFSPDGKTLAAGGDSYNKVAWVWDAETGKELLKLTLP